MTGFFSLSLMGVSIAMSKCLSRSESATLVTVAPTPVSPTPLPSPKVGCTMPEAIQEEVSRSTADTESPNVKRQRRQGYNIRTHGQTVAISKKMDWDCDGVSNYDDNC